MAILTVRMLANVPSNDSELLKSVLFCLMRENTRSSSALDGEVLVLVWPPLLVVNKQATSDCIFHTVYVCPKNVHSVILYSSMITVFFPHLGIIPNVNGNG